MTSFETDMANLIGLASVIVDLILFIKLVEGDHTGQPYVATGFTRLSISLSMVLVVSALVSRVRLMEKNARRAFFLSSSVACLNDPFKLNLMPR